MGVRITMIVWGSRGARSRDETRGAGGGERDGEQRMQGGVYVCEARPAWR
jgi:hypothetical protein